MARGGPLYHCPPRPGARRMKGLIPVIPLLLVPVLLAAGVAVADDDGSGDDAPSPGEPGAVTPTPDGFSGRFVSGTLPTTGTVLGEFSVGGVALLDQISVSGWAQDEVEVDGSSVEVQGTNAHLTLDDRPAAYLTLELDEGATATAVAADGASLVTGEAGSARISSGSVSGLLWADCGPDGLQVADGAAVLGPANGSCKLRFRADTDQHPIDASDLEAALASGRLAAEVTLGGNQTYSVEHVESFEPVEVQVQASDGHVVVAISGSVQGPRSVVLVLPDHVLPQDDSVEATLDGRTMSLADANFALATDSPGDNGSFARVSRSGLEAVVLSIPTFSVHLVEIAVAGSVLTPLPSSQPITAGDAAVPLALGAIAAVGAGAALLRRPRD